MLPRRGVVAVVGSAMKRESQNWMSLISIDLVFLGYVNLNLTFAIIGAKVRVTQLPYELLVYHSSLMYGMLLAVAWSEYAKGKEIDLLSPAVPVADAGVVALASKGLYPKKR